MPPERVKSGPKNGEWIVRRDDGTIKTRVNYKDGIKDGLSYLFYNDGKTVQLQIPYKSGKRHGTSVKYFEDGSVYAETNYEDDVLHGVRTTHYRNGQLKSKITYRSGLAGSDLVEYYKSGNRKDSPQITYTHTGSNLIVSVDPMCDQTRFFFGGMNDDGFFDEFEANEELFQSDGQYLIDLKAYTPSYLKFQDLVCSCKSSQGNPVIVTTRIAL